MASTASRNFSPKKGEMLLPVKCLVHSVSVVLLAGLLLSLPAYFSINIYVVSFRVLVLLAIMCLLVNMMGLLISRATMNERIRNALFSVCFTLLLVFVLECAFMFVPMSHGIGYTYGAVIWSKYFWHPTNSFGFRDKEPAADKSAILFVGDSFTAGHGIRKVKDRYSDIVGGELREFTSVNIGQNGLDTQGEYEVMTAFVLASRIVPTIIVLQYYGNDIEKVAIESNVHFGGFEPYQGLSSFSRCIVKGSFLANYIYWLFPHADGKSYIDS